MPSTLSIALIEQNLCLACITGDDSEPGSGTCTQRGAAVPHVAAPRRGTATGGQGGGGDVAPRGHRPVQRYREQGRGRRN